jgi:rhodanese-related sulfurtransferase
MNWTATLVIALALALIFILKRVGQISSKQALEYLKNGALVVDVRSPGEFSSRHLSKALNIPLGEIESALPCRIKDKQQVLLLHCQSGMRSGMAAKTLKTLGYVNAFNLGSYARAAGIVGK